MKPIEFLGDSLDRIREFPLETRRESGHQLDSVQRGLEPDDWKPMKSIGPGVREIRLKDATGIYRVVLPGPAGTCDICPAWIPEKDPENLCYRY